MIQQIATQWNAFWFSPARVARLAVVRLSICLVAALWFASFLPHAGAWFGERGILSNSLSQQLIAFEEVSTWQVWSPLWLSESVLLHQAWLVAGIVLALTAGCGWGRRWTLVALLLWTIAWTHRIVWLSGPTEPALIAMLAYLIVEPGDRLPRRANAAADHPQLWTANLSLRLVQTHCWILIAAGVLTQLASYAWWRGEAVWWLAASGRSSLLSIDLFSGRAWLVNLLTHAAVAIQLLTLWLLTVPVARRLGVCVGLLTCCLIGLVADQLLYAALLAVCLLAFWETEADRQGSRRSAQTSGD